MNWQEILKEHGWYGLTNKQHSAFLILEEYMEVPNGTADQMDEFVVGEVKGMSSEVIDVLIKLYEELK